MKRLRPMLVPAASFLLAWAATFLVSRRMEPPPPAEPTAPRLASPRPRVNQERPRHRVIAELAGSFRNEPIAAWPGLWDDFAATATVADLVALAATTQVPRRLTERRDARNIPRMLALEELAARSDRPPAEVPGAYATFAERDPEAALRRLGLNTPVARTLAGRDPAGTLRRLQTTPAPLGQGRSYESDAGEGGMSARSPLEAIFAAWARHDPAAAASAVSQLPPADRAQAAGQVALTWAYRDGPAAIRFLLDAGMLRGTSDTSVSRLHAILRASLRTHGAETARLIATEPALRKAIATEQGNAMYGIYKPWHDADPAGLLAWVLEEEATLRDFDNLDGITRWNSRCREVLDILECDPNAAATMIRGLAAAGSNHGRDFVPKLRHHAPVLAAELARELGITLPDEQPRTSRLIDEDPARACDLWLAALREHQDPEQALAALAWSKTQASKIAYRAALFFPEKAAELAPLVPASMLYRRDFNAARRTPEAGRFWPDLIEAEDAPIPPRFPLNLFLLDPAAAASSPLAGTPQRFQVEQVIEGWALYDPAAAMSWLARVTDPAVRQAGEATLFRTLAAHDPAAALQVLIDNPSPDRNLERVARSCLRRIMAAGGDWRGWVERIPPAQRPHGDLADFDGETQLLEKLRQF